jgi:hypothetical protein
LITIRKRCACLHNCRKDLTTAASGAPGWLILERSDPSGPSVLLLCNFNEQMLPIPLPARCGEWSRLLWSRSSTYGPVSAEPPARVTSGPSTSLELAGISAALYIAGPALKTWWARGVTPAARAGGSRGHSPAQESLRSIYTSPLAGLTGSKDPCEPKWIKASCSCERLSISRRPGMFSRLTKTSIQYRSRNWSILDWRY